MNKKTLSSRRYKKADHKIIIDSDVREKKYPIKLYRLTDNNVSRLLLNVAENISKYRQCDIDPCLRPTLLAVANRISLLELNCSYISEFGKSDAQCQIAYQLELWIHYNVRLKGGDCDPLVAIEEIGDRYNGIDGLNNIAIQMKHDIEARNDKTNRHDKVKV